MTKKLLLPSRIRRMQIRQQHVLDQEKSTKASQDLETYNGLMLQDQPPLIRFEENTAPYEEGSVVNHNRQLEETENNARLERWIEDQKAHQQNELPQQEKILAVSKSEAVTTRSPPPPTLPLRPWTITQPSKPQSHWQGLLQQIREVGSTRSRQTSLATERPLNSSSPTEDLSWVRDTFELTGFINGDTKSKPTFLTAANGYDMFPQPDKAAPPEDSPDASPELAVVVRRRSGSPTSPPTGETVITDPNRRKSPSPPVPPKPVASRPDSTDKAKTLQSPTNPYHSTLQTTNQFSMSPSTRTFASNCGNFKVEAELLDWKDGKVWLRKVNGVKIAVPLSRFSGHDVEFVVAEMMRRAEERRSSRGCKDSQASEKGKTGPFCDVEAGLQSELESAYAVVQCYNKTRGHFVW